MSNQKNAPYRRPRAALREPERLRSGPQRVTDNVRQQHFTTRHFTTRYPYSFANRKAVCGDNTFTVSVFLPAHSCARRNQSGLLNGSTLFKKLGQNSAGKRWQYNTLLQPLYIVHLLAGKFVPGLLYTATPLGHRPRRRSETC